MKTVEIECKFLEIDKDELIKKLHELKAHDEGEKILSETIIYDPEFKWRQEKRFIRLRKVGDESFLTYKHHHSDTLGGSYELEMEVGDYHKAELLFEKIGFPASRHQEKKRHTFILDEVVIDIDSWPKIPTYVELEGEDIEKIKSVALKLGYDWSEAVFKNAGSVIEEYYKIPVTKMKWFTFDKME